MNAKFCSACLVWYAGFVQPRYTPVALLLTNFVAQQVTGPLPVNFFSRVYSLSKELRSNFGERLAIERLAIFL